MSRKFRRHCGPLELDAPAKLASGKSLETPNNFFTSKPSAESTSFISASTLTLRKSSLHPRPKSGNALLHKSWQRSKETLNPDNQTLSNEESPKLAREQRRLSNIRYDPRVGAPALHTSVSVATLDIGFGNEITCRDRRLHRPTPENTRCPRQKLRPMHITQKRDWQALRRKKIVQPLQIRLKDHGPSKTTAQKNCWECSEQEKDHDTEGIKMEKSPIDYARTRKKIVVNLMTPLALNRPDM